MSETTSQSDMELSAPDVSQTEIADDNGSRATAIQRLVGTVVSPEATFKEIDQNPSWVIPFLFGVMISFAFSIYLGIKLDSGTHRLVQDVKPQITEKAGGRQIQEQDIESLSKAVKGLLVATAIFGRAILFLVLSVIFAGGLSMLGSGRSFKKVMSVIAWSNLAPHICGILVFVISLEAASLERLEYADPFNYQSLILTNLSGLLRPDSSPVIVSALNSLDPFIVWFLILLTIGLSATEGEKKLSKAKAGGLVFGLWMVWITAKVGVSAVWG